MNIYPTDSQRMAAWNEYTRIYLRGGFGTRAWDNILKNHDYQDFYQYLTKMICKKDSKFLVKLREKYSAREVLNWFMPSKELIDNGAES